MSYLCHSAFSRDAAVTSLSNDTLSRPDHQEFAVLQAVGVNITSAHQASPLASSRAGVSSLQPATFADSAGLSPAMSPVPVSSSTPFAPADTQDLPATSPSPLGNFQNAGHASQGSPLPESPQAPPPKPPPRDSAAFLPPAVDSPSNTAVKHTVVGLDGPEWSAVGRRKGTGRVRVPTAANQQSVSSSTATPATVKVARRAQDRWLPTQKSLMLPGRALTQLLGPPSNPRLLQQQL